MFYFYWTLKAFFLRQPAGLTNDSFGLFNVLFLLDTEGLFLRQPAGLTNDSFGLTSLYVSRKNGKK